MPRTSVAAGTLPPKRPAGAELPRHLTFRSTRRRRRASLAPAFGNDWPAVWRAPRDTPGAGGGGASQSTEAGNGVDPLGDGSRLARARACERCAMLLQRALHVDRCRSGEWRAPSYVQLARRWTGRWPAGRRRWIANLLDEPEHAVRRDRALDGPERTGPHEAVTRPRAPRARPYAMPPVQTGCRYFRPVRAPERPQRPQPWWPRPTTLDCASSDWHHPGRRRQLARSTGIPAQAIARWRHDRARATASDPAPHPAPSPALDRDTLVLVDEAGMVSTRDLEVVLSAAQTAGAKVVLVGDRRQLASVGGSSALRGGRRGGRALGRARTRPPADSGLARAASVVMARGDAEAVCAPMPPTTGSS